MPIYEIDVMQYFFEMADEDRAQFKTTSGFSNMVRAWQASLTGRFVTALAKENDVRFGLPRFDRNRLEMQFNAGNIAIVIRARIMMPHKSIEELNNLFSKHDYKEMSVTVLRAVSVNERIADVQTPGDEK